ncbi:MAG: alpha/beta fold hydrolase [Wenzhouxiangella sp.]|nr:alpha/beta fold hydrolase [Wenzhouxiangella sp.]
MARAIVSAWQAAKHWLSPLRQAQDKPAFYKNCKRSLKRRATIDATEHNDSNTDSVTTDYRPPLFFRSAHLQTIYPTVCRRLPLTTGERERIDTPDGDFLDLDWARDPATSKLAILTHGLEGHSRGAYVQGMARALKRAGWNVLAWNFRGCSGEPNRCLQSYHSGATGELQIVLDHVFKTTDTTQVALIGFSLGGNLTLKYLGDQADRIDPRICAGVGLSVPCDLASSAYRLEHWHNRFYMARFMRSLCAKVREKAHRFPGSLDLRDLDRMRTFAEFDDRYTAPIHGFKSAIDYWTQSSCRHVLNAIQVPTLLLSALDDPFLTPECFPFAEAKANPHLTLETPRYGGHLGFITLDRTGDYWSEQRVTSFLSEAVPK